jgi:hypothetical protein
MSRFRTDFSPSDAETLAVAGLVFLASDTERLEPFLSLSGLNPGNIRAAATDPGFLRAVLEHIVADESLLMAFAANEQRDPADVLRALHKLGGGPTDWNP